MVCASSHFSVSSMYTNEVLLVAILDYSVLD